MPAIFSKIFGTKKPKISPQPAATVSSIESNDKLSAIIKIAPELDIFAREAADKMQAYGLVGHKARVCLVLDVSASMAELYRSGKVQKLIERALALACFFDDDMEVEVFPFGTSCQMLPTPIDLHNYAKACDLVIKNIGALHNGTQYATAIKEIREHYFPDSGGCATLNEPQPDDPVFVLFVTDGEDHVKAETLQQFRSASYQPMFFKFIALGNENSAQFKFLCNELDDGAVIGDTARCDNSLKRYMDNADTVIVQDPTHLNMELLLREYPDYLREGWQEKAIFEVNPNIDVNVIKQNGSDDRTMAAVGNVRLAAR